MPKKKLLMILGAGSSVAQGMPSVADLNDCMMQWSAERVDVCTGCNYFAELWKSLKLYYEAADSKLRLEPNFEKILGDMVGLATWMTPAPNGNSLRQIISGDDVPPLDFPTWHPYAPFTNINAQLTYLLSRLAQHMRILCLRRDSTTRDFQRYQQLIAALRDTFDIGLYNLNYDNVALTAWPKAFTGFDPTGRFDPRTVHQRRKWNFIYHLHGSVYHTLPPNEPLGSLIQWQHNLNARFNDGDSGRSTDRRSDNKSFPLTTLIVGGFKLDQLLIEPFQSFYAAFIRHVYEADAILIGGYGFGDAHINRALQNRLAHLGARPPVIVLTKSHSKTDPMQFCGDTWGFDLCETLSVDGGSFSERGYSAPPSIAELIAKKTFELSSLYRVAIWHGGFVESVDRLDGILPWLDGHAPDSVLAPPANP